MDKARFDSLMKLAEFRSTIRESRRQHEWRVSLGIWIGMGAAIISLRNVPVWVMYVALPSIVLGHAWLWVRSNWVANERDARLLYFFSETAEGIVLEDAPTAERRPVNKCESYYGFLIHAPPLFQILATALLAFGLALFSVK